MRDELRLITTADPSWDHLVAKCPSDFYHGRAYHRLAEQQGEGEAYLAVYGSDDRFLAWPYLRRRIDATPDYDATSVYGYTGPIGCGLNSAPDADATEFLAQAWLALQSAWRQQGLVSMFTRFHPLLRNAQLATGFSGAPVGPRPAMATLGRSVSIDLNMDGDERLQSYDKETRYEIRRAGRLGLEVDIDRRFAHLGALVDLYHQTMLRNGAEQRYLFTIGYFEDLVAALHPHARLVVATVDGDVAGGLLYVTHGLFAQAHLTGVADRHLRLSPLKALLHAAGDQARLDGAQWLHLGAGRGGAEDSLFEFKRRIARIEHQFVIGRWVLDEDRYATLSEHRDAKGDFFPAYRAPVPAPLP